jgi:hypothetical protein
MLISSSDEVLLYTLAYYINITKQIANVELQLKRMLHESGTVHVLA